MFLFNWEWSFLCWCISQTVDGESLSSLSKSHPSSLLSPPLFPHHVHVEALGRATSPSPVSTERPPLSWSPGGTEVSLWYLTTCPGPSCFFSGNAESWFFACSYRLPWVWNCQQTTDNLAKILGKNQKTSFAWCVSFLQCSLTAGTPVCPEQPSSAAPGAGASVLMCSPVLWYSTVGFYSQGWDYSSAL